MIPVAIPIIGAVGVTIGGVIAGLSSLVDQIKNAASELMDKGDEILARQQMLLADTLHSLIDHLEKAYHDQMNATFDRIDQTERNFFNDLRSVVVQLGDLEGRTARDLSNLVQQTQDSFNQILDRVPFMKGNPVIFAARPKDLLFENDAIDVEIVGYHLIDGNLSNKKPDVFVEGVRIDPAQIGVTSSRLQVLLPEDLKARICLDNTSCQPMRPFSVRVIVYFSKAGFLNLIRNKKQEEFNFLVPAGVRQYMASVSCSFHPITNNQQYVDQVTAVSPHIIVDQGGLLGGSRERTEVTAYVPTGTRITSHNAFWTPANAEGYGIDRPVVGTDFVTAKGWLSSKPRWQGRAWGEIHLTIAYAGTRTVSTTMPPVTLPDVLVRSQTVNMMAPSDRGEVSHVEIVIKLRGCPETFDKASFDVPKGASHIVQSSQKGQFTITVSGYQIEILKNT